MLIPRLPRSRELTAESGFTLMETLVAGVAGVLVAGVLLTILVFSMNETTRVGDRVYASQIGRTAMSKIIDELHSSCTGASGAGIAGPAEKPASPLGSTGATNLWFISAYGSKTSGNATIEGVREHDINWTLTSTTSSGQKLGTLTDYSFASSSGNSNEGWKFPALTVSNATATVLAKNVIAPQIASASTIFQYSRYESSASSENFGKLVSFNSSELPASQSTAAAAQSSAEEVARVEIAFTQAAEASDTRSDTTATFSDAVDLRFEPSETAAESKNEVCT